MLQYICMGKRRSTIADVAEAAGVSIMTVSRAVNGRPGVGEGTRDKVRAIAEGLGYRPDRRASALASRSSAALGIVFPDMANPFFAILAKAATDTARARGLNVFVMNTDESPTRELSAFASLHEERIEGIIVAGSRLSPTRLGAALEAFAGVVLVNNSTIGPNIANVDVDDRSGMIQAVTHLLAKGRTRIAFAAGPRVSVSAQRRLAGYRTALAGGGLAFERRRVVKCTPDIEGGRGAAIAILGLDPDVDAIIAYNDITAIGVMRGLADSGRRIPEDVAVIGGDDIPYAALVRPSLSTLRVDIPLLGRTAMSVLLALRDGTPLAPVAALEPELIVRESSG